MRQLELFPPPIRIHTVTVGDEQQHRISRVNNGVIEWWQGTQWDCECMAMTLCGEKRLEHELATYLKGVDKDRDD